MWGGNALKRALQRTGEWATPKWPRDSAGQRRPSAARQPTSRGLLALKIEGSIMDAKIDAKGKTGTLTVGNKNWDLPVYQGTIGPDVVDIAKLYAESGMFTYDP